jgi:hypothetical protein
MNYLSHNSEPVIAKKVKGGYLFTNRKEKTSLKGKLKAEKKEEFRTISEETYSLLSSL